MGTPERGAAVGVKLDMKAEIQRCHFHVHLSTRSIFPPSSDNLFVKNVTHMLSCSSLNFHINPEGRLACLQKSWLYI
jgi:hypothetical protein